MPTLTDSLAALADYSAQIHTLAASNLAPSGPYTTAYLDSLHLNPATHAGAKRSRPNSRAGGRTSGEAGVLSLIRDAQESEVRLFRFIGEAEVAGVGRVKRVEKRDEAGAGGRSVLVPRGGEGRDEVEVMLKTALRLVDDYRPMPRARATIASLLETHHSQLERVAELELKIEDAISTPPDSSTSLAVAPPSNAKPNLPNTRLTFEEAVKAEELALRSMESQLVPLRKSRIPPTTDVDPAFIATSSLPSSPPVAAARAQSSRTPAKTPQTRDIRVTNSLVNGTTPRRPGATPGGPGGVLTEGFEFDRFSPLKFLGTPRARGRANTKSTLREVMGSPAPAAKEEEVLGRGIFGRPRVTSSGWEGGTSSSAGPAGGDAGEDAEEVTEQEEDQTVRFLPGAMPDMEAAAPAEPEDEDKPDEAGPAVAEAEREPDGVLEGIQFRLPIVEQAIGKIRDGLPEMLRQGLPAGSELPEGIEATITHIGRLSRSDPSPPPSPSSHSTSTLSSTSAHAPSGAPAPPITPQTILTAHLLLAMLRGDGAAATMNELKDDLGALARARGWESSDLVGAAGSGGMVTKCIYHVVGKRVAKIDRKAGARVMFAI